MPTLPRHCVALLLSTLLACSSPDAPPQAPPVRSEPHALLKPNTTVNTWTATGSIGVSRAYHALTALPSGKALLTGGWERVGNQFYYQTLAQLYDPATATWSSTSPMATQRAYHASTLLPSGKVLVTGGIASQVWSSAEVFDPATGTWSSAGSMSTPRFNHTATRLPSGKVLVTGGADSTTELAAAELYDPTSNTWSPTGAMAQARSGHTATLLATGKVLVTGGSGNALLTSAEVYDPATGTWSSAGSMMDPRSSHFAALLPSGKVLVTGGSTMTSTRLASAELYDPSTNTWSRTGSMASGRALFTGAVLPSGHVLVAAGDYFLASVELYDPSTGTWSSGGTLTTPGGEGKAAALMSSGEVLMTGGLVGPSTSAGSEVYGPVTVSWAYTGNMTTVRTFPTATLLASGKVLVTGGAQVNGPATAIDSAELYDPATNTWSATAPLPEVRSAHMAVLLPSGKALVTGGYTQSATLASSLLYDPATGTWSATGSLATARSNAAIVVLPSGKVLIAGGAGGVALASAELYDPSSGTWSSAGSMSTARFGPKAVLLASGKVLVIGGCCGGGPVSMEELYDPATNTWTSTGSMSTARYNHTATLLPTGKVLVTGGSNLISPSASAELYDPATGTWSAAPPMSQPRASHTAVSLPSGKVLIIGGQNGVPSLSSAEWYDPSTGAWAPAGRMIQARGFHAAVLLGSGRVLAVGGTSGDNSLSSAELYQENLVPVAADSSGTTVEETPVAVSLSATDPDGDTLTYTVVSGPTHGTLSGTAPHLTYTPATNFDGSDSFTFRVNDGAADSHVATVSLTVTPVNDAPVAALNSARVNEDASVAVTLAGTDVDGDTLAFTVMSSPAHGTLSGTEPYLTYTPAANFHGSDAFTFRVNDATAGSNVATVSITVVSVNDAPQALAMSVTTPRDTPAQVVLVATDVDGDPLTYEVTPPSHGTLTGTAPDLTYTPAAGYTGMDSFTYRVKDGTTASATATVSLTMTPRDGGGGDDDGGGCGGCTSTSGGAWIPWALGLLGLALSRRRSVQ